MGRRSPKVEREEMRFLTADELRHLADTIDPRYRAFVRPGLLRRRYWTPAVEEAGLTPLRMHDLRHTAISLWIAGGGEVKPEHGTTHQTNKLPKASRY